MQKKCKIILNRLKCSCESLTEKSMFFLSWLTARGSGTGSVCLITDTDSPAWRENKRHERGKRWESFYTGEQSFSCDAWLTLWADMCGKAFAADWAGLTIIKYCTATAFQNPYLMRACTVCVCACNQLWKVCTVLLRVRQRAFDKRYGHEWGREERRKIAETLKYPMEFATN